MTFPYDTVQPQTHYNDSSLDSLVREQRLSEEASLNYFDDRAGSAGHGYPPYKQCAEYNGQGVNGGGHFLTQELERLHMSYGTENVFDRNHFFQRELRT